MTNKNEKTFKSEQSKKESQMLWSALKELKLRFDDVIFDLIEENDIIEIYDKNQMQRYRNPYFHSIYDFSLLELFSKTRSELFAYEKSMKKEILKNEKSAFSSSTSIVFDLSMIKPQQTNPQYQIVNNQASQIVRLRFMLPLFEYNTSEASHILLVSKVHSIK